VRPTLFLLALMMILTGCGYKAPLYLPGQKPAKGKSTATPAPQPAPASAPEAADKSVQP
jgi:predicted small lipoprotein YifL